MKRLIASLALAAVTAGALPAAAQVRPTGTLRVVVKDPSGAVIPNAAVVVKGIEPSTQDLLLPAVTSDGQGVATALNVPVGRYAISVTFPLFLLARELRLAKSDATELRNVDSILLAALAGFTLAFTIWVDVF